MVPNCPKSQPTNSIFSFVERCCRKAGLEGSAIKVPSGHITKIQEGRGCEEFSNVATAIHEQISSFEAAKLARLSTQRFEARKRCEETPISVSTNASPSRILRLPFVCFPLRCQYSHSTHPELYASKPAWTLKSPSTVHVLTFFLYSGNVWLCGQGRYPKLGRVDHHPRQSL